MKIIDKKIRIIYIIVFFLVIFNFNNNLYCAEEQIEAEVHEVKHEAQIQESLSVNSGHAGTEQNNNANKHEENKEEGLYVSPIEYHIVWSLIILILVLLLGYFMKFISVQGLFGSRIAEDDLEHEQDIETSGFAMMLVVFAIVFYSLLMIPEIFGYFDEKTHTFVKGFHESNLSGLLRFIIVTLTGIIMTIYAFLGKHNQ